MTALPAQMTDPGPTARELCLERARQCAAQARLSRKIDGADLLDVLPRHGGPLHDETLLLLLRLLPEALKRRVVFHRPGATETTFDEDWLLRLFEAISVNDDDTISFALGSRVSPRLQPAVRSLAQQAITRLDHENLELS
ncbi:MAG: hypothetical protein AAF968_01600 [Pseudomonadota bacterium]